MATPNQDKSRLRKHLMRSIGGGLIPGDNMLLPDGKKARYVGNYNIDPENKRVSIPYYIEDSNGKYREMPSTASIKGKEYTIEYRKAEKLVHDIISPEERDRKREVEQIKASLGL